jgi:3-hydroxyacyl-CoA dehydrogenase
MENDIKIITVVGAGTMGREIAQVALMGGLKKVILHDINKNTLDEAYKYIKKGIKKFAARNLLQKGN